VKAATFPPTATLGAKLDAIAARVIAGSRHPAIRARAAEAVQASGGDAWRAFEALYAELLRDGVRLPDPGHAAGEDRIEPAHVTLGRLAGDCDDWTVLVLALARSLGFMGSIVTLSGQPEDGPPVPLHVFATVERMDGADVSADATEGLALGEDPLPIYATATLREVWPVEARSDALGFLGAVIGLVSTLIGGNTSRKNARDARAGAEAQARAVASQAEADALGHRFQRDVGLASLASQERIAALGADLRARDQKNARRSTDQAFAFLREMAPVGAAVAALAIAAPIAQYAIGGR